MPAGLDVHLVLDNLKTHKTRLVHDWLVKRPRCHLHFTPTRASWLNLVECWFALLSRRRLERGVFTSTDELETAIHAYIDETKPTRSLSSGPRPPTTSSPASHASANGLLTQTTRRASAAAERQPWRALSRGFFLLST